MNDLIGKTISQYQIVEELGMGGMATVFKAYQSNMDRHVAVKVLPQHFAQDPTFVGRFEQEARVIARLEHARILPVYDFGSEDGITFIVMRYLEAGTLTELIQDNTLSLQETSRILSQVAEGLDYAHKKGIIHRDMKPSNIMLDSSGDVYITDFGIAKLSEGASQFTGSGIVGTPAYISPEQGLGNPIDQRSDVYSLGVVLYQMAIGDVPFRAETPMAVVIKHIHEPLPPPRIVKPNLPPAVEGIIMKAMAKDPEARFQTCGEMATALAAALRGETVAGLPSGDYGPLPSHRAETSAPSRTAPLEYPGVTAAMTTPMPSAEKVPTKPGKPPAPARRSPVVPILIGAVIALTLLLGAFALALATDLLPLGGRTSGVGGGNDKGGPGGQDQEQALPLDPAFLEVGCLPGESLVVVYNGEAAVDLKAQTLTMGGNLLWEPDSIIFEAEEEDAFVGFSGQDYANATIHALITFPEDDVSFALDVRSNLESIYYQGRVNTDGEVSIWRGTEMLGEGTIPIQVGEDRIAVMVFKVSGNTLELFWNNRSVLIANDPSPLPPGVFAVSASGGQMIAHNVWVCARSGSSQSGEAGEGSPFGEAITSDSIVLIERFESQDIDPRLEWFIEPVAFEQDDRAGMMITLSESGINTDGRGATLDAPFGGVRADALPETDFTVLLAVSLIPDANYQKTGLLLTGRAGNPLFGLTRGYCEGSSDSSCAGDAIYFDAYTAVIRNRSGYAPFVAGVGSLPTDRPVILVLAVGADTIFGFYSADGGTTWVEVGSWPLILEERLGAVGWYAESGFQPVDARAAIRLFGVIDVIPSLLFGD